MVDLNTTDRYKAVSIALHWLVLFLMLAIYASIEIHEMIPRGNPMRGAMEDWHIYLGFLLLPIVVFRLVNTLRTTIPPISPTPVGWQPMATKLMKVYLYLLMLGMPLLGWLYLSADGEAISVWGIPLPAIAPQSEGLAEFFEEAHEILGLSGYLFIPGHALAALYHHYFVKDNTLRRMLPGFMIKKS